MDKQIIQQLLNKYEQLKHNNQDTLKFCFDPVQKSYREGINTAYSQIIEDLKRLVYK